MPLYSDSVLDEVRSAVNIVSLVSEYVALKKRGRNHVARCPFHNEKTPSFSVSEEKQIFMCFGCGIGGDVFRFVMQIEHLSFVEAVQFHRRPVRRHSARNARGRPGPAVRVEYEILRKAMAEAVALYNRCLLESQEGKAGSEIFAGQRGHGCKPSPASAWDIRPPTEMP